MLPDFTVMDVAELQRHSNDYLKTYCDTGNEHYLHAYRIVEIYLEKHIAAAHAANNGSK